MPLPLALPVTRRTLIAHALCLTAAATSGCAGFVWPQAFEARQIHTRHFVLAARVKIRAPGKPLRVYVEGDGHAFNAHGRPSSDPTPRDGTLRDIAFADPHPNVAYLARPCQFVKDERCSRKDWSTARFSKEAVDSVAEAIQALAGGVRVTLVGYSGGGQMAGLAAVTHPELKVAKIVSIAGNLDHPAWCAAMRLPPLAESLDLTQYRDRFGKIPQIHFVGSDDRVIAPAITRAFVRNDKLVVELPDVTHTAGWMPYADLIYAQ